MFEARLLRSWEEPSLELGRAFFGVGKSLLWSWEEPSLELGRATSQVGKSHFPTAEEPHSDRRRGILTPRNYITYDS